VVAILAVAVAALAVASSAWAVGELSQKPGGAGCIREDGAEGCATVKGVSNLKDVAISPDGRSVYVISSTNGIHGTLTIFDRDPATGELRRKPGAEGCVSSVAGECQPGRALEGAVSIAVSPDGRSVYVASLTSNAVAIFSRDPATGALRQSADASGCVSTGGLGGCQPGRGLAGADTVAVSPDNGNVYVGGVLGTVASFRRQVTGAATGQLSQEGGEAGCVSLEVTEGCAPGRALEGLEDIAVSPDGANVYAASAGSGAVAVFNRAPGSGSLGQKNGAAGCLTRTFIGAGCADTGAQLEGARRLAISPDGRQVYVVSREPLRNVDALTILGRNPETGELHGRIGRPTGCIVEIGGTAGCETAIGIGSMSNLAASPDGGSVYVLGVATGSVASFDRNPANGTLAQRAGAAGCFSAEPTEEQPCRPGRALQHAESAVVSPDGRSLYVVGEQGIAIFDRAVPPTPPAPDTTAPTLSGFRLAPPRFAAKPKGHGSHFRFTLSEPAGVGIEIQRAGHGKRPLSLTFANRPAGASSIAFGGRVGKRILAPGAYRATIVATDAAGNRSNPQNARFTVLVPRRHASTPPRGSHR
jgi:DNA-binding beta-propeller fold protein YncE